MNAKLIVLIAFLFIRQLGYSQGTFQNMDFEAANLSGYQSGSIVPTADAFPDWQVSIGTAPNLGVYYDAVSIGSPALSVVDGKTGYSPIQGNYTAYLMSAVIGNQSTSVTISQTGVIPTDTESIQLYANQEQDSSFVISLGGDALNLVPLQVFTHYTLYGANVSAWAGQDVTLSITELPPSSQTFSPNLLQLDEISFPRSPLRLSQTRSS